MKRTDFKSDKELLEYLTNSFTNYTYTVHSVGGMYINNDAMVNGVKQLEELSRQAAFARMMGETPKPFNALEKLGMEMLMEAAQVK